MEMESGDRKSGHETCTPGKNIKTLVLSSFCLGFLVLAEKAALCSHCDVLLCYGPQINSKNV